MKILETATFLGEKRLAVLDTFKNSIILEKTGIEYVYETNLSTIELANRACKSLNSIESSNIQLVLLVTQSPDSFLPANAVTLVSKLDISQDCLVFDINQGCSGFVQAICMIDGLLSKYKNALLVTADRYRSKLRKDDRSTNAVFSDAASASIISAKGSDKILFEEHFNDGNKRELLYQSVGKHESQGYLVMHGAKVWMFTKMKVIPQILRAINFCEENNIKIKGIYLHQASKVVVQSIKEQLPIKRSLIFETYQYYGNTVSSSIPFAIKKYPMVSSKNSAYIFSGFGVGLTSSTIVYGQNG